ncbi:MerR family transcriptional regulator [Rhizosaccharibacter radicis]|uniref:MerR family transcriptional regulator n=1 Tax=Rhizosaccharibacter radicis TaxID=2782605 RepID=A0ABT1VYC9_9PROT|nr:MerR family transcriptional regulator [Acetobacteraceae bacterium KSS12]
MSQTGGGGYGGRDSDSASADADGDQDVGEILHDDIDEDDAARPHRLKKAPSAFRTISEVADELHIPQHVLRFWETRFPQVRPLKRGGGRRYYRPDDIELLRRIAHLLYIQGYTIKGVQRLLREGDGTLRGDLPPPDQADPEAVLPAGRGGDAVPPAMPVPLASGAPDAMDDDAAVANEPIDDMATLSIPEAPDARGVSPGSSAATFPHEAGLLAARNENRQLRDVLEAVLADMESLRGRLIS